MPNLCGPAAVDPQPSEEVIAAAWTHGGALIAAYANGGCWCAVPAVASVVLRGALKATAVGKRLAGTQGWKGTRRLERASETRGQRQTTGWEDGEGVEKQVRTGASAWVCMWVPTQILSGARSAFVRGGLHG